MPGTVACETDGAVALLTSDRPQRLNATRRAMEDGRGAVRSRYAPFGDYGEEPRS